MGKSGDQKLDFQQNKTLTESKTNGADVHLFEVLDPGKYIYLGQVELADNPYQSDQIGANGLKRAVWMFPIRLKNKNSIPVSVSFVEANDKRKKKAAENLSNDQLQKIAQTNHTEKISIRPVTSNVYLRDAFVSEYARRRANGICPLCMQPVPFVDISGKPTLSVITSNGYQKEEETQLKSL